MKIKADRPFWTVLFFERGNIVFFKGKSQIHKYKSKLSVISSWILPGSLLQAKRIWVKTLSWNSCKYRKLWICSSLVVRKRKTQNMEKCWPRPFRNLRELSNCKSLWKRYFRADFREWSKAYTFCNWLKKNDSCKKRSLWFCKHKSW